MSSLSPGGTVALGVVVGLLSTCVQSVGLTLQRKSHMLEDEKEDHIPRRAPYRRRRWQVGMLLFLLSNVIGSSIQITTLPLPLLSTLQASGLVFNALLATLLLCEPFTRRTAIGTLLVAGGAVLISLFSALPEPSHTLDQLLVLLVQPSFIAWMTVSLVVVVAVLAGTFAIQHLLPYHQRQRPRTRLIRGMAYGFISGVLSAHSLLLAKSAVELLVRTIVDHKNQFNRYQSWLLLLLFLFFALIQLYYLHRGLKLVTTSILYPFVFCIYNIVAIMDGLIYFRQMDRLPPVHAGLIALGTAILLAGVLALSWRLEGDEDTPDGIAHVKTDIPPSALTPGMGLFDEDSIAAAHHDYNDDDENDLRPRTSESAPLLRRHTLRDSALAINDHRRRRSTLLEAETIWNELHDEEARFYGTVDPSLNDDTSTESGGRASRHSLSKPLTRQSIDGADSLLERKPVGRVRTAPLARRRDGKVRPRSEQLCLGGVQDRQRDSLTRSLARWWRGRWKGGRPEGEGEEDDAASL